MQSRYVNERDCYKLLLFSFLFCFKQKKNERTSNRMRVSEWITCSEFWWFLYRLTFTTVWIWRKLMESTFVCQSNANCLWFFLNSTYPLHRTQWLKHWRCTVMIDDVSEFEYRCSFFMQMVPMMRITNKIHLE